MMKGIPRCQCTSLIMSCNLGYPYRLVPINMVFPLFIHCMSYHMIFGVVYEVVTCMHVWYHPPSQRMHVLCRTYQLVTQSLGAVIMRMGGAWVEYNHKRDTPPQWNNIPIHRTMVCLPLWILVHSFVHSYLDSHDWLKIWLTLEEVLSNIIYFLYWYI